MMTGSPRRPITKAICAVQAPRRLRAAFFASFFLLLKKRKSPKASKATNDHCAVTAKLFKCVVVL